MISASLAEGISETLEILNHIDEAYVEKIPLKFIEFLEENKSRTYFPDMDHSKKLNELKINARI